jgi:hypothetical protein
MMLRAHWREKKTSHANANAIAAMPKHAKQGPLDKFFTTAPKGRGIWQKRSMIPKCR